MNKFKVGDKVKEIGSNEIKEIDLVSFFDDGTIGYVLKFDDSEMYYEDELELYKTPHQELLDLGWELSKVDDRYIEYINEEDDYLIIDKIEKTYYNLSSYYRPFDINLQLAKILVRYLEELE